MVFFGFFFGLYQTLRSYTRECYFYCVSLTRSSSDLINSVVSKEIIKRKAGLKCNSLIRYMIKFGIMAAYATQQFIFRYRKSPRRLDCPGYFFYLKI